MISNMTYVLAARIIKYTMEERKDYQTGSCKNILTHSYQHTTLSILHKTENMFVTYLDIAASPNVYFPATVVENVKFVVNFTTLLF